MSTQAIPIVSHDPVRQARYEKALEQGATHKFAEMLALQQFPGTRVEGGNDTYFQGKHNNEDLDKMLPATRAKMLRMARQAGVSIGGKVYCSGIARFPGDPKAWVSDVSQIKEVCQKNKWAVEGVVNYTPTEGEVPDSASLTRTKRRMQRKKEKQNANRTLSR